jgi:formylglycine-generating enzyme required for sulfatase activity
MKLVRMPPSKFKMGSPEAEVGRDKEENQHDVEITREFWLGIHEVTQKQFKAVMGYNPSYFSKDGKGKPGLKYVRFHEPALGIEVVAGMDTSDFPVENVSWAEADEFCKKLTARTRERGRKYRLPTEAEWEYACRAGASSYQTFHFGNSLSSKQANFDGNHPYGGAAKGKPLNRTCKVGSYDKNAFGLYDMHGNVAEWCADWYDENYYEKSPPKDPSGPLKGSARVLRGGHWYNEGQTCRSACRDRGPPDGPFWCLGFRVALVPSGL